MEIRRHGRYDNSAIIERPQYDWPGGKRLACYIGLNIEHFSCGEGLGHTPKLSSSLSTGVTRQIDMADAVVVGESAAQPMLAAPIRASALALV